MNSALSGLPPLPKSLSGLLNPEDDTLPSFTQGLGHAQASSAFRPVPVGGSHGGGGQVRNTGLLLVKTDHVT